MSRLLELITKFSDKAMIQDDAIRVYLGFLGGITGFGVALKSLEDEIKFNVSAEKQVTRLFTYTSTGVLAGIYLPFAAVASIPTYWSWMAYKNYKNPPRL